MMGECASRPLGGPQGVCVGLSEQYRRSRSTGVQRGVTTALGPGERGQPGPDHGPHTQGRERKRGGGGVGWGGGGVGGVHPISMSMHLDATSMSMTTTPGGGRGVFLPLFRSRSMALGDRPKSSHHPPPRGSPCARRKYSLIPKKVPPQRMAFIGPLFEAVLPP